MTIDQLTRALRALGFHATHTADHGAPRVRVEHGTHPKQPALHVWAADYQLGWEVYTLLAGRPAHGRCLNSSELLAALAPYMEPLCASPLWRTWELWQASGLAGFFPMELCYNEKHKAPYLRLPCPALPAQGEHHLCLWADDQGRLCARISNAHEKLPTFIAPTPEAAVVTMRHRLSDAVRSW